MHSTSRGLARILLWLEPLLLGLIALAMWYPTPTRSDWLWTLLLLVPMYLARYYLHRRFVSRSPLDYLFLAFLILGVINVYAAPFTRGLMMLSRPLFGIACCYALVENAREHGSMAGPLRVATLLALLLGLLAVGSTQWNTKAMALESLTGSLPRISGFPGAEGGFNANEIAGAIAWLLPLMAALAITRWRGKRPHWDFGLAFFLLFVALFLGQSRSTLFATFLVLFAYSILIVQPGVWRWLSWALLALLIAFQLVVMTDFLAYDRQQAIASTAQDNTGATEVAAAEDEEPVFNVEQTMGRRFELWQVALLLTRDYPLTGVGLGMYRYEHVRADYPIPDLTGRIIPHAHNEVLQVMADMGLPGLAVFIGFHVAAAFMAWRVWQFGDRDARVVMLGILGGLLAHAVYGLVDAVTLWDRFAFLFWIMLGLLAAQYRLVTGAAKPS